METFIKYNNSSFKNSLLKEYDGLKLLIKELKQNPDLDIPQIISVNENILEIEKIDTSFPTKELSIKLGKGLANLHKKEYSFYGLDTDNYIGLNPQKNIQSTNWGSFFVNYRLLFQIDLIQDSILQKRFKNILKENSKKIEEFLNNNCSHPSLVHGDLWSGNVLYSQEKVYLIDPAIYYGDREVDIAMSEMFGGFTKEFYDSYNETYPLSPVYEKKKIIYNLYHYLNHYNLFGSGYLSECEKRLEFIQNRL